MINNTDEWQAILYAVVTFLFVAIVILKMLTNRIKEKLEALKAQHPSILNPCPFCGNIPEVKNGYFFCKTCRIMMFIPLRRYSSVEDMLTKTWNRRWSKNKN